MASALPVQGTSPVRAISIVSLIAAATAVLSWIPTWSTEFALGTIYVFVVTSFAASGVFLLSDRSTSRTGWAMIVAAICYEASWWWTWPPEWEIGPAPLISFLFGYWWFAVGGLALLRYPEPVLSRRYERWYFVYFAIWVAGVKLFIAAVSEPEWAGWNPDAWWLTIAPHRGLFDAASAIFKVGVMVLAVGLIVLLLLKIRRSRGLERADSLPASAAGIAIGFLGSFYIAAQLFHLSKPVTDALRTITALTALIAPIAFLISLTQRRLARSGVADLVVRLADCTSLKDVQSALREVLGDPTMVLAVQASPSRYVTCEGYPLTEREMARWRVPMPAGNGRSVALLLVDPALRRRADLVRSGAVAGGLVLENGLLRDDLAAQLAQVQASRRRIAEAGLAERRRIERNLHDGAQQLLLRVMSSLSLAKHRAQRGRDPSDAIETAGNDLDEALAELRNLARGIHPAVLGEMGLQPALQGVADRLTIPVTLDVTADRLPDPIEETLYFVICEALTNVIRHAGADAAATVRVTLRDGTVVARVADDGRGGASFETGSGLAGLRDRVETLRGDMTIATGGDGTTVTVRIPCG
ncbi:ATP-binding protein [Actinoplanes sp. NPDC026619]|uniref:sensor histidine kinase n=1 Tax=Actinoplanes sp. NPDC026619 TaxID=3155798 RepID=UPI0034118BB0